MTDVANFIELSDVWNIIPQVKTIIMLVAFALSVVLSVVVAFLRSNRRSIPTPFWIVIPLLVVIGVIAAIYKPGDIYRVRVTVLNLEQIPIDDATVWSSFGGEPKKVAGGWQFDIPSASKPQEGKLVVFASQANAFLVGKSDVALGDDYNPAVTIRLARDDSAKVRGQIIDGRGNAIAGAHVWVVGYGNEGITTKADGGFELAAHKAVKQQVELHAESLGYKPTNQFHPAGDDSVTLILFR